MAIMVVDDSDVVRSVVRKALSLYGFNDVLEAEDGEAALLKAQSNQNKVDMYVLDINMPKMDGITLVGEIRKFDNIAPIIMLTTETDKAKMIKAKTFGATGWIIKPFDSDKFIKVVEMFLKKQ
jgi:two-component system chemotaxis response regulator CheY